MSDADRAVRTRAARKAKTADALIGSARAAFAAQGYAAASMDDICAAAGVTRGALYHTFGGKVGLLEAVATRLMDELDARLDAEFAGEADAWVGFCRCCDTYLRSALNPEFQRIVLRDAPAVLGERLRAIDAEGALAGLTSTLSDMMDAGRIRRASPEALARFINGGLVDSALWIAASGDPATTLAEARAALTVALKGLETAPPP
jgi:AcrR family transcriptional regulator